MGKSTATEFLRESGVAVVDTDTIAREVVAPGQPALNEVAKAFGATVIAPDGTLRRGELASMVFSDSSARLKLESILHPRIRAEWQTQVERWRQEQRAIGVVVIPLLFETKAEELFDDTVCVACAKPTQIERLRSRGWTSKHIEQRNEAQLPIENKMAAADYVVWTEGTLDVLNEQLRRIFTRE